VINFLPVISGEYISVWREPVPDGEENMLSPARD